MSSTTNALLDAIASEIYRHEDAGPEALNEALQEALRRAATEAADAPGRYALPRVKVI